MHPGITTQMVQPSTFRGVCPRQRQSGVHGRTSCCGSGQPAPKQAGEAEGTTTDDVPKPHLTLQVGVAQIKSYGVSSLMQAKKLQEAKRRILVRARTSGFPVPRMHRDITLDGAISVLPSHALQYSTLLLALGRTEQGSDHRAKPYLRARADC